VVDMLFVALILFFVVNLIKALSGKDWACFFGFHRFGYLGNKHGMHYNKAAKKIAGTTRKLYQCRCGKIKRAENEGFIKTHAQ